MHLFFATLFPDCKFFFFRFFWNIFFFCATSSSGLGTVCSFSVGIVSVWQGVQVQVNPTVSPAFWGLCSAGCAQWAENLHLSPSVQLYSLHFWACAVKIQHSLGRRPCIQPHCLACAHLPTPPLEWRNGTHCFFKVTSFRYLQAFQICIPFMAWALFTNVLKVNMKIWTSWFTWFCGVFWVEWIAHHF